MFSTLGDDAAALSTVKKWAADFKRGRESLEDDHHFEQETKQQSMHVETPLFSPPKKGNVVSRTGKVMR